MSAGPEPTEERSACQSPDSILLKSCHIAKAKFRHRSGSLYWPAQTVLVSRKQNQQNRKTTTKSNCFSVQSFLCPIRTAEPAGCWSRPLFGFSRWSCLGAWHWLWPALLWSLSGPLPFPEHPPGGPGSLVPLWYLPFLVSCCRMFLIKWIFLKFFGLGEPESVRHLKKKKSF